MFYPDHNRRQNLAPASRRVPGEFDTAHITWEYEWSGHIAGWLRAGAADQPGAGDALSPFLEKALALAG